MSFMSIAKLLVVKGEANRTVNFPCDFGKM